MGKIELNEKAKYVFDTIKNTSKHVFLTGVAGTGKSTLVRHIVENMGKPTLLVAPTGIAATNIGGTTIHSTFGIPIGLFCTDRPYEDVGFPLYTSEDLHRKLRKISKHKRIALRKVRLIVVDEVSMLRADLLDAVDVVLRKIKNSKRPFGGVQMFFVGDMMQLPPVIKEDERELFDKEYDSVYFFSSHAYRSLSVKKVMLDQIYRQTNLDFISILNNMRDGVLTNDDIYELNSRVKHDVSLNDGVFVTTHNYKARQINDKMTQLIKEKTHLHFAEVEGYFNEDSVMAPGELILKKGMRVMTLINMPDEYFNGKIGTIMNEPESGKIIVEFDDGSVSHIDKYTWENIAMEYDPERNRFNRVVLGMFTQYPLKAAYAITVHKSQGLTFDTAILDIREVFASGQAYTALSRLRSIEGLTMISHIGEDVQIDMDQALADFIGSGYVTPEKGLF